MTVVRGNLNTPAIGGPVIGARVVVRLYLGPPSTAGYPEPGFRPSTDQTIVDVATDVTDAAGLWEFDLVPNSEIVPANTVYQITEEPSVGSPKQYYITVPVSGVPLWAGDLLVDPPGALDASGLQAHLMSTGPHDAYYVKLAGGSSITPSAAGVVGLVVKAAPSQAADLVQMQDSAGAVVVRFDSAGRLVRGQTSATVDSVTSSMVVTPTGDNTNALTIKSPGQSWGRDAGWGGAVPYGKGQAIEVLAARTGTTVLPDDQVVFRVDPRGNCGMSGLHVATGLRPYAGEPVPNQAVWIDPSVNTVPLIIHNPTVAESATWTKEFLQIVDARNASAVLVKVDSTGRLVLNRGEDHVQSVPTADVVNITEASGAGSGRLMKFLSSAAVVRQFIDRSGNTNWMADDGTTARAFIAATSAGAFGARAFFDAGVAATSSVITKAAATPTADAIIHQDSTGAQKFGLTPAGLPKWATGNVQTTVGATGAASVLPANPVKYLKVVDDTGATRVVPCYNP